MEINNKLTVNIEVNSSWNKRISKMNFSYMTSIYSQMIKINSNYNSAGLISFDISAGLPNYYNDIEYMYMQNDKKIKYIQDFEKRIINTDKIKKYWYNWDIEGINKNAHILILTMIPKELEELITYLNYNDS